MYPYIIAGWGSNRSVQVEERDAAQRVEQASHGSKYYRYLPFRRNRVVCTVVAYALLLRI